jgi:hypothetical protein
MFASRNFEDDQRKNWIPYVIGMTITAALTTIGSKLAEWLVDELRFKFGSTDEEPVVDPVKPVEETEQ